MQNTALIPELEDLGLTTEEARTYVSLLTMGRGYVSIIAKHAQVSRVNCYHLLDNLVRRGLASVSSKDGKKMYQAANPDSLVKQQVVRLRVAEKLLPNLKQLGHERILQPSVRRVEGKQGIRSIFEETLESADEILGYTNVDHLVQQLGDYLYYYAEERIRRKVRSRFMSPLGKQAKKFLSTYYAADTHRQLAQIIYIDPAEFPFDSEVYIYGNSVASFSLRSKELFGVIIDSPYMAQTYRSIFNLSWLGATSFVLG